MKDVMLDLETFGTSNNSVIVQIGTYKISAGKYVFNKDDVLRYITARATVNQETFEFSQPEGEK